MITFSYYCFMLSQSDFSRGTMVLYFVNIEILAGDDEMPTY